jgi:hypothetical protein
MDKIKSGHDSNHLFTKFSLHYSIIVLLISCVKGPFSLISNEVRGLGIRPFYGKSGKISCVQNPIAADGIDSSLCICYNYPLRLSTKGDAEISDTETKMDEDEKKLSFLKEEIESKIDQHHGIHAWEALAEIKIN